MITVEEAKEMMNLGKSVVYDGVEYMRIISLNFKKGFRKYDVYAELLDKNRNCITTVPIDFLDKDSFGRIIDLPRFENIKEEGQNSRSLCSQFFNILYSGKLEQSQERLHDLIKSLLVLENILEKEIQANEKLEKGA